MADGTISTIQNSFAGGELAPALYGRTDLKKYPVSAAVMKNFFVDYKGGASTVSGTQFIGEAGAAGNVRLVPFMFSSAIGQTYMLVFSHDNMRVIKNPGTPSYPNSTNSGFVLSGGVPYQLATPYNDADLPRLKFLQIADTMWLTCHGYMRRKLQRFADDNWVITEVTPNWGPGVPLITDMTVSALPTGSTDPVETTYMYAVSAVDENGTESPASPPEWSDPGINIGATIGTVSIFWTAIAGAIAYRVYKALPANNRRLPAKSEQLGFCGWSYGTSFTDSNILADFTQQPITTKDPFAPATITGYTITASSADWPVGLTNLTITDSTGTGAYAYPILDNNEIGGVGSIIGMWFLLSGRDYTAPTVTATGGGTTFTATLIVGPDTGLEPAVVGLVQQRLVYASSREHPITLWFSRPGALDDFRVTNPTADGDAITLTLAAPQIDDITWLREMPGGLLVGSNSGVVQITGGSSGVGNPSAITPSNVVASPQSGFDAALIDPIIIDRELMYMQSQGSVVRGLSYNLLYQIYTSEDLTELASHLFYPNTVVSWAYQDTPNKIAWAVRSDGVMLGMTYLKSQEVRGWTRRDTQGLFKDVAVVREGSEDAIYVVVDRGGTKRYVERIAGRTYIQISDAWCLDSALSVDPTFPAADLYPLAGAGSAVPFLASAPVFSGGDVGKVIWSLGARGTIMSVVAPDQVQVNVTQTFSLKPDGAPFMLPSGSWSMDSIVSTVNGLSHLDGRWVMALVDGVPQGSFLVSGGSITLSTPGSRVVVGLSYQCQLQPLFWDPNVDQTVQGKRKKVAASVRIKDASGLKYGPDFQHLRTWVNGVSSTDPPEFGMPPGLMLGDQRIAVDQTFGVGGWLCVQQDLPLPATVLAIIPEMAMGDTSGQR